MQARTDLCADEGDANSPREIPAVCAIKVKDAKTDQCRNNEDDRNQQEQLTVGDILEKIELSVTDIRSLLANKLIMLKVKH